MADGLNWYLVLELDPTVQDQATIDARIVDKKRKWSREKISGSMARRRKAATYLKALKDIQREMSDPTERARHAKEARAELQAGKVREVEKLRLLLEVKKTSSSTYTPKEVQAWVKACEGSLSGKEVETEARKMGLKPAAARGAKKRALPQPLDQVVMRGIHTHLETIGLDSLYVFLDRGPRSSLRVLVARSDEVYREQCTKQSTDLQATAKMKLTGFCQTVFKTLEMQKRYDFSLATAKLAELHPMLEQAGSNGRISQAELLILQKMGQERGVDRDLTRQWVEDRAVQRKWELAFDQEIHEVLPQCGICDTVVEASGQGRCKGCGAELSIPCPRCKSPTPTQDRACGSCGANTGDWKLVRGLMAEADSLIAAGRLLESVGRFDQVLVVWPGWKEAERKRAAAVRQLAERDSALAGVEPLIWKRHLRAAARALDRFVQAYGANGTKDLRRRIDQGLADADKAWRAGEQRRQRGATEAAVGHYQAALQACADHAEAQQALTSCPPPSPGNLQAAMGPDGLRLSWAEPGASGELRYRVVRKARGAPSSPSDGTVVGEVSGSRFDDIELDSGVAWFYAVYTLRSGVTSARGSTVGPCMRTAEVEALETSVANGQVSLRWKNPAGVERVEVWRGSPEVPRSPGQGVRVTVSGEGARDTGLTNGERVGYLVVAVFRDPRTGAELLTPGRKTTAVPAAPPAPVKRIEVRRSGRDVSVSWQPPRGSDVQLRVGPQAPGVPAGTVVSLAQAHRFGQVATSLGPGRAQIRLESQGQVWITALSVRGDTAVVGDHKMVTTIDDVSALKAQAVGRKIVLTWAWPQGVNEVAVCFRFDRASSRPSEAGNQRRKVTQASYDRTGCFELRDLERQRHYVSVYCRGTGEDVWSTGAQVVVGMGQEVIASYRVQTKKALFSSKLKSAWLVVECSGPAELRDLVLVGATKRLPLRADDGETIANIPHLPISGGKGSFPIPDQFLNRPLFLKLFFIDAADSAEVRLRPGPKGQLALS